MYDVTPSTVSPSICKGAGRSNSTVIVSPERMSMFVEKDIGAVN